MILSGDDQALLNATGHDYSSFSKMLYKFKLVYDPYSETEAVRKKLFILIVRQRGNYLT